MIHRSFVGIARLLLLTCLCTGALSSVAQTPVSVNEVERAMLKATRYMVDSVSTNGGYVSSYLPDFSRRWGEMEAYPTMIWVQDPGTVSMGYLFLDAYHTTKDEYYYQAAQKVAHALIWGQLPEGGWNYMIDFAGDRSLKQWYKTIGKNGWRLEEFHRYYGNSTFDDDVTSNAARFLLCMYLEKQEPQYKPSLEKAIDCILNAQYPNGGWPQRYPKKKDLNEDDGIDYTGYYTFNDDVIWENIQFLLQCYEVLGEVRFLDPILRGMDFYLLSQDACGAWGQQLSLDMKVAGARSYEPAAFLSQTTYVNAMLLLTFYQYTGDRRFLSRVPDAIKWLEKNRLSQDASGRGATHPAFVDVKTGTPVYVHRNGSNVANGAYFVNDKDDLPLAHYGAKRIISVEQLKTEYQRVANLSVEEATKDSPLKVGRYKGVKLPQSAFRVNRPLPPFLGDTIRVDQVLSALDDRGRWLVKHAFTSHPYRGEGGMKASTTAYASTNVGDEAYTSPYRDTTDQLYLSTAQYIRNMKVLIDYLIQAKGMVDEPQSTTTKNRNPI